MEPKGHMRSQFEHQEHYSETKGLVNRRHGAAGEEGMDSYNAGAQERETTLNQLLIELDGFDTGKGVVFLGATNRMDMLDPALLRPGRFDRKIAIRPPRAKGRYEILKVHSKGVKLDESVDLESYAKNLPGWSGAELAQLLQEAALVAVRHGGTVINRLDMDRALDRLTMGSERIGLQRRLPVHRRMATHETGLALTSHLLRRLEDAETEFCDRVSIVPRGETLARTIFDRLDDEAYLFERLPALLHRLQVMLGGRAAEEVMYGRDTSTFSLLHLPDASWLARKLVSVWNLEGGITITGDPNPWSREAVFTGPSLGFEGGLYDNYGFVERPLNYDLVQETTLRTKALLDNMYMKTLTLLKQHHAALTKAVYVVMEKEELFGEELDQIIDLYPLGTSVQVVEDEEEPGDLLPLPDDLEAGLDELRSSSELRERILVPEDFGGDDDDQVSVLRQKTNGNGEARKQLLLEEALRREKEGSTLEGGDIAATTRTSTVYNDDATAGNSQTPASVRTGDIDSNF
jgi:ATP-dependent Zn protease